MSWSLTRFRRSRGSHGARWPAAAPRLLRLTSRIQDVVAGHLLLHRFFKLGFLLALFLQGDVLRPSFFVLALLASSSDHREGLGSCRCHGRHYFLFLLALFLHRRWLRRIRRYLLFFDCTLSGSHGCERRDSCNGAGRRETVAAGGHQPSLSILLVSRRWCFDRHTFRAPSSPRVFGLQKQTTHAGAMLTPTPQLDTCF